MTEKYLPSCGSEGCDFIDRWCSNCKHDQKFLETGDGEDSCPIVAATFRYDVDAPEYPEAWTYDDAGNPICTAFEDVGTPDKRDENAAIRDLFA